ncbi:hypothetical protein ACIPVB_02355 [Microbacterium sp. NPDC090007]|uniref:hypothetical protein n=1 Tax=Microbacterium sp. NPDC090007 TaxID=3364204 RepID=UPI00382BE15C
MQPELVTRLRILSKIVELTEQQSTDSVSGAVLLRSVPEDLGITQHTLEDHVHLLDQRGLVKGAFTMGGLSAVFIKPAGKDAIADFERERIDPIRRLLALQDELLRWAYIRSETEGLTPSIDAFLATGAGYLGVDYTLTELARAAARLLASGLMEEGASAVTSAGMNAVENNRSVREIVREARVNNVTAIVTGGTNVNVGGSHLTQSLTASTEWGVEVARLLDVLADAVPALPEGSKGALAPLIGEAHDATVAGDSSRVRRALNAIGVFLADTATGALGGHLASQIPQVLALLG